MSFALLAKTSKWNLLSFQATTENNLRETRRHCIVEAYRYGLSNENWMAANQQENFEKNDEWRREYTLVDFKKKSVKIWNWLPLIRRGLSIWTVSEWTLNDRNPAEMLQHRFNILRHLKWELGHNPTNSF